MKKKLEEKIKKFLSFWLAGTTCYSHSDRKVIWISPCEKYIVAKHTGHPEYCGRMFEVLYCETFYELHKINSLEDIHYSNCGIKQWKGYWSKVKQKEAEEIINKYY